MISRNLLTKMLERLGHTVFSAENGQLAWEFIRKQSVQILIADWMMPEMDGLELCRKVRELNPEQYIYIIILTAKDDRSDLLAVFHAGADDYITKPFDPEELRARIVTSKRIIGMEERYIGERRSLMNSRNDLNSLFNTLDEQLIAVDDCLRITFANKAFLDAAKTTEDTLKQCPFFDGYHVATGVTDPYEFKVQVEDVLRTGIYKRFPDKKTDDPANGAREVSILPVHQATGTGSRVLIRIRVIPKI